MSRFPSTFSIVAHDPASHCWGVGVQSKFLAVGAVVPWARAGAGAIATQAHANTSYGPRGLALLESGLPAKAVVEQLTLEDPERHHRQLGVADATGGSAAFTGKACYEWAGHLTGPHFSCQGNLLAGPAVVENMAKSFQQSHGLPLAERLLAALLVVKEKGGYGGYTDQLVNLRVDDHSAPIEELARLYGLHQLYFGQTQATAPLQGDMLTSIQDMLKTLGYYRGQAHGQLDVATQQALEAFCNTENLEMRRQGDPKQLDVEILKLMETKVRPHPQ